MRIESYNRMLECTQPLVMGIINLTPDSFFSGSRSSKSQAVDVAGSMLGDGASIIDLGAMSTRPGAIEIDIQEELDRLIPSLEVVRKAFPDAFISVDTYRPQVALHAFGQGADMINDISGGTFDPNMFPTIAATGMAYVIMHTPARPQTMQENPVYENVVAEVKEFFQSQIRHLEQLHVNRIIVDPGFGFGKTLQHNYQLLGGLPVFKQLGFPVMAGISRKSMIYRALGITAAESLNGTSILNTIALLNGADLLRVHDVKQAVQAVQLICEYKEQNPAQDKRFDEVRVSLPPSKTG